MNNVYKAILLIVCVCCTITLHAQTEIKIIKPDATKLPHVISFTGNVTDAIKWTDKNGEHIVLTTETGIVPTTNTNDPDNNDAYLYAYHFIMHSDSAEQVWKIIDFVKECPLDIEAAFIKNTLQATDLDKNGVPEIWVMYKTVCHGDVSPASLKIIMYQDKQKFAMRGRTKIKISDTGYDGGEYSFDTAFTNAPAAFRDFAKSLWNKNMLRTYE